VSSVGIVRDKVHPHTADGMHHTCFFRHALALDERRVKFLPEYVHGGTALPRKPPSEEPRQPYTKERPHVKEVWFRGSHSDMYVLISLSLNIMLLINIVEVEEMQKMWT